MLGASSNTSNPQAVRPSSSDASREWTEYEHRCLSPESKHSKHWIDYFFLPSGLSRIQKTYPGQKVRNRINGRTRRGKGTQERQKMSGGQPNPGSCLGSAAETGIFTPDIQQHALETADIALSVASNSNEGICCKYQLWTTLLSEGPNTKLVRRSNLRRIVWNFYVWIWNDNHPMTIKIYKVYICFFWYIRGFKSQILQLTSCTAVPAGTTTGSRDRSASDSQVPQLGIGRQHTWCATLSNEIKLSRWTHNNIYVYIYIYIHNIITYWRHVTSLFARKIGKKGPSYRRCWVPCTMHKRWCSRQVHTCAFQYYKWTRTQHQRYETLPGGPHLL